MLLNLLAEGPTNPTSLIIMGVLILGVIALFIWNSFSNKKKQKAAIEKMNAIKVGDKVKTIGGICGFIVELNNEENTFVMQTGFGDNTCFLKFDKQAIYQTAPANGYFNDVPDPVPAPAPVVEPVTPVESVAPATASIEPEVKKEDAKPSFKALDDISDKEI